MRKLRTVMPHLWACSEGEIKCWKTMLATGDAQDREQSAPKIIPKTGTVQSAKCSLYREFFELRLKPAVACGPGKQFSVPSLHIDGIIM